MFIDYVALMLINLVAGLFLLAYFLIRGDDVVDQRRWAPGFAIVGIIAIATGLHMIFTWPLPGSANIAFGEATVLLGGLFLGGSLSLALGAGIASVSVYALPAGLAAVFYGSGIIMSGLTRNPTMAGAAFILVGIGGILLPVAVSMWRNNVVRWITAAVLLIAVLLFGATGYGAILGHLEDFRESPPAARQVPQQQQE